MEPIDLNKEAESIATMVAMVLAISMTTTGDRDDKGRSMENAMNMATEMTHGSLKKLRLKLRDEILSDVQLANKSLETAINTPSA